MTKILRKMKINTANRVNLVNPFKVKKKINKLLKQSQGK
jgi:hypothetical protein